MNLCNFNKTLPLLMFFVFISACAPATKSAPTATLQPTASPAPTQPPCSTVASEPTPIPGVDSRFPAVRPDEWSKGPADAAVTIVVYNDFQCLECNDHVLSVLAETHPKEVRLVYRPFPQPDLYDKAWLAATAAEAAGAQDRFWDMHDILFAKQSQWVFLTPDEFKPWAVNEAERFGMDRARFESDFNDPATSPRSRKRKRRPKRRASPSCRSS